MGSTSGYILDIFSAILSGTVAALGSQLQPLALVKEFSSQGAFKEFSVQGILGPRNLQARKLQSLNFRSQQFSGQGINFQAIFVWELSKRNFQSKNFRVTMDYIPYIGLQVSAQCRAKYFTQPPFFTFNERDQHFSKIN